MTEKGIISTYESGVDVVFEWKIEDFFNLPVRDGAGYDSPDFSFEGETWYLTIFPNGWSGNDSSGHVDLCLWKCHSHRSIKQSYSLSLKTVRREKYNEQHFSKDFGRRYPENYHGLLRFPPRSELTMRTSELVPEGVLTVVCTMKSSTSAGNTSNVASSSAECCQCKGTFNADSLTSHQKKCQHRPVKCPDCLEIVVLQKWFDERECQQERPEAGNDPGHATVEASIHRVEVSTQTVKTSIQSVEASIQTVEEKCEAFTSGSSTNPQENKVLHDFKELFFNKEDCDVTINVKGSEFSEHRLILKARSPVFASTFRHDMKENTTGVLEIQDCDSSIFSDFLCFLYCGDVSIISQENVFGLFTAADKYQVLDLRAKCLEFMKMNITVDTFCETITLALRHFETELIRLCTEYFKSNVPKIIVTVKWQTFLAENPTESNELLVKFFVPNSSWSK